MIHGWQYRPGVTQGPRYVGKFINKYVYERLPAPVLQRLREINPVVGSRRRHKHFQFLTDDIGEPSVDRHLASVTTLMSVSSDRRHFDDMFRMAFPKPGQQLVMGTVLNPPLLSGEDDSDPTSEPSASDAPVPDGSVEILEGSDSVRARILSALGGGNTVGSGDLAMRVYGNRREATLNKLRKRMQALKMEGLVETPSKGIWKATRA